jgi:hypothetical protein
MTLAQLEESAKKVRGMKIDLVVVAVPPNADAPDFEGRIRSYAWVLNWSLSFGNQQWDVIAVPPSTTQGNLSASERQRDLFARCLIAAQDLSMITRRNDENRADLRTVVERWLKEQARNAKP